MYATHFVIIYTRQHSFVRFGDFNNLPFQRCKVPVCGILYLFVGATFLPRLIKMRNDRPFRGYDAIMPDITVKVKMMTSLA